MKTTPEFALQFDPSMIPDLASRYSYSLDDGDFFEAGRLIAQGDCSHRNLETIFRWKTRGRGISRLTDNIEEEVADALHLAVIAKTERSAVAVLIGLRGVDVPVASAILTAVQPERYTIIDFRALQALGSSTLDRTIGFYLWYLKFCRSLAAQCEVSLRVLDRALWQWSSERSRGN